jgi:ABC-type nitrate/sulfonate/bicarbonate transport system permease component
MENKKYLLGAPIIIIIAWQVITGLDLVSPLFLPAPTEVIRVLLHELASVELWKDLSFTLYRAMTALALAVVIGVPVGLLMGYFDKVYHSLEFAVEFFRATPATSLFPLFMLFFGIGDLSKIALAFWATSFIIIIYSMYGVKHGKRMRLDVARVMNIHGYSLFRKFIFPEALPNILTGTRIAMSNALIIVVVTEMFIGTSIGIGHRIIDNQMVYNIPEMYSAILIIGTIGYILNKLFIRYEKRIVHWSGR